MINSEMPSMLEIHSQALQSVDDAYHTFLLIYQQEEQCVYGFVEGKDDPCFYHSLIQQELPEKWSVKLIPSGSRDKVIRAHQSFNWNNYSRTRICFFVDRDMHDFLCKPMVAESNVYVTDGYSIENFILEWRVLNSFLYSVYEINLLHPDDESKIKQIVQVNEEIFFEAMLPLMGQIMLWRQSGAKANLNNLKLDAFFSFKEGTFQVREDLILLKESSDQIGCECSDADDISAAVEKIRLHARSRMMIRGKYVLWFFVKQCEAIWESIPKLSPNFPKKPNKRLEFGLKNAMVHLGPYAYAPNTLKEFIKQNYLSFISQVNNTSILKSENLVRFPRSSS
jgi:hypothetical protein